MQLIFKKIIFPVLVFIASLIFSNYSYSQTKLFEEQKNGVIVEVLGHSHSIVSVNYERFLYKSKKNFFNYTFRAGIGYTPSLKIKSERLKSFKSLPVAFTALVGKKKHFAQFSIGYTPIFGQNFIDSTTLPPTIFKKFESVYIASLGYRFYDGYGTTAQVFPTLNFSPSNTKKVTFGFGFSIGATF